MASSSRRRSGRFALFFWAVLPFAATLAGAWIFGHWWLLALGFALMATVVAVSRETDRPQKDG